jgi:type VI secretion system protein VasD
MIRRLRVCASFLILLVLLVGCTRSTTLQMRGVAPLNVNDAGESTPVDVRIFQLKDDGAFRRATFEKLWTDDKTVLGQDSLAPYRVVSIVPGNPTDQPKQITIAELESGTRFIGVMALYAKADARDARTLVLPVDEADEPVIELSGYGISLAKDGKPAAATTSEAGGKQGKGK